MKTGKVIATIADYASIYDIVANMLAEAAQRTVPDTVRETVEAVKACYHRPGGGEPVRMSTLVKALGLDRTTVNRRVNHAIALGYLSDLGGGRGRLKLIEPGDHLPDDSGVLPPPQALE